MRRLVLVLLLLGLPSLASAQLWSGVIATNRAIDWTTAGVTGGIPTRTTICTTLGTPGQSASYAQSVTAAQINTAMTNCNTAHASDDGLTGGGVVYLNAGTYTISSTGLNMQTNVTLRGAGADQTILSFSGSPTGNCDKRICFHGSTSAWAEDASVNPSGGSQSGQWTAGYTRDTTAITLASIGGSGITNGKYIYLDQLNLTSPSGEFFVCEVTNTCSEQGGNGSRNFADGKRGQAQIVKVVSGCTSACAGAGPFSVTITPGLYGDNWNGSRSPGFWFANTQMQYASLENLTLDDTPSSSSNGTVSMWNTFNSWVTGVRSMNANRAHIQLAEAAHNTIANNYFYGTKGATSQSYGVESYLGSDNLIVNNISQRVSSPFMAQITTGNVFLYNFEIFNYYCTNTDDGNNGCNDADSWGNRMGTSNIMHNATVMYTLWEGNVVAGMEGDAVHGTGGLQTLFRNRNKGYAPYVGTRNTQSFQLYTYNRAYNIIGNVLGTESFTTAYEGSTPSIYVLGGAAWGGGSSDASVKSTMFRWGNYDVVSGTVRWCGQSGNTGWATTCSSTSEVPTGLTTYPNSVPSTETLPSSLYYSARPSWWPSSKAWPPIGPDVTGGNVSGYGGHVNTIPAQDCYTNTMGGPADGLGSVLTFNAATCYTYIASPSLPVLIIR